MMRTLTFIGCLLLTSLALAQSADVVILDANVVTMDPEAPRAQAVAVRGDRIIAVGTNQEIEALIGDATRVVRAGGRMLIPGLIETHVHATGAARGDVDVPFLQLGSIAEIQAWIRDRAANVEAGGWILAPRVDVTRIAERRIPTRAELDEAAPNHPVVFNWQYANRQIQVLNSAALQAAEISGTTEPPARGKIQLDVDGKPTGVLENAGALIYKFTARREIAEDEYLDSLEQMLQRYNAVGITSICERNSNVDGVRAYQKLRDQSRLSCRVTVTIGLRSDGTVEGTEKFIRSLPFQFGEGDDWVRVGPLKIGVDGGILYGTAYMREPYGQQSFSLYGISDPMYQGDLRISAEHVKNIIRTGHRLGWQMCSHVTGDKGVDVVLDAVAAANEDRPIQDRRYTLIHAYFPHADAARRAAELGVCVDTQPAWYYKDGDALAEALGGARLENFIGVAEWQKAGVRVALNSDHMQGFDPVRSLNPFDPFLTMYVAVARKTEGGQIFGEHQRVTREDALRMMTIDAAYLCFDEDKKGSVAVGKLADLALLSDDLLTCDIEVMKDIRPVMTLVGGRVVYESPADGPQNDETSAAQNDSDRAVDLAPFFQPPDELKDDFGDYRSPLMFANGQLVTNAQQWQQRREEILQHWHERLGHWPPLIETPKIIRREQEMRDNYTLHHVDVEIAPQERMTSGYLLVPQGPGPFPAVVVVYYEPETGIGRGKNELRDFAHQLARRGFVTLSIGTPSTHYYPSKEAAELQPLSSLAYAAANCRNALSALDYVDADRIGIVGHSYGGKWAMFASCLYDKFACGVWSDGGIVFDESRSNVNYWEPWYLGYDRQVTRKPGIPSQDNPRTGAYQELMKQGMDLHELHALMAPRPFLVSGGSEDPPQRWRALNHSLAVNRLLGYERRVAMTNRPGHAPTEESNAQIYAFFEHALAPKGND